MFLLILLLARSSWGQEDICIGQRWSIYSQVLHEERAYWVHLPDDYGTDREKRYPVIYLLDGDSFFHVWVGFDKTLSSGKRRPLPSAILVGVLNVDRARDFTPTASAAGRDGRVREGARPQGGGSESFSRFLTEELRSRIDSAYRTDGQTTLVGHSYAGLFTLNTFLSHTEQFDNYLAVDPSLWWDQGRLVKEADSLICQKDFSSKRLYVGIASKKREDRVSIHQNEAELLFDKVLPQARNLQYHTKFFPEEVHGTVPIPGFYDGIKQLFGK